MKEETAGLGGSLGLQDEEEGVKGYPKAGVTQAKARWKMSM